jgi:homoaconitase/3-isopropylmalate dehydratase large subunit
MNAPTLAEKVWDRHVVRRRDGEPDLLYVDLHLVHEVTSPQAFEALRLAGRRVRRPELTLATMDHNVPTTTATPPDDVSVRQMEAMAENAREFEKLFGGMPCGRVGVVSDQPYLIVTAHGGTPIVKLNLKEAKAAWKSALAEE